LLEAADAQPFALPDRGELEAVEGLLRVGRGREEASRERVGNGLLELLERDGTCEHLATVFTSRRTRKPCSRPPGRRARPAAHSGARAARPSPAARAARPAAGRTRCRASGSDGRRRAARCRCPDRWPRGTATP